MKYAQLFIPFVLLAGFLFSCSGEENVPESASIPDGTTEEQVQYLVDNNRFDEALDILKNENMDDETTIIMMRDTHLLYGNWLMYHADTIHMTERMPKALRHFRRVLEIDPENRQASSNIEQIESIYEQMGRPIPEGVAE